VLGPGVVVDVTPGADRGGSRSTGWAPPAYVPLYLIEHFCSNSQSKSAL
jgi:hypothetical protein